MHLIEQIVSSITPNTIDPETAHNPKSSVKQTMLKADFSAYLSGLSKAQEYLFYCKYLGDDGSCKKGLKSFRAHLYRNNDFMCWVRFCTCPDRMSENYHDVVNYRTSLSPTLSWLAYKEVCSTEVCDTCMGAAKFEGRDEVIACQDCDGTGHITKKMNAQQRADYLHVGLSIYWKVIHQTFYNLYLKPLTELETKMLIKINDNYSGSN